MLTYWSQLRGCGNENHAKSNDSGMLGLEYSSFKGFGWVTRLNLVVYDRDDGDYCRTAVG